MNVFILFLFMAFLFFFMAIKNVYKQRNVRVLESTILLNLIVLSTGALYKWESNKSKMTLLEISIGIILAKFCVYVVWSLIRPCLGTIRGYRQIVKQTSENIDDVVIHERIDDPELKPLITLTGKSYDAIKTTY